MQYICRTHAQTTDFSQNTEQTDESGCNSFKYNFRIPATSQAHRHTDNSSHHHRCVDPLQTPGHLKSCLCLLILPMLRHSGQYRKSGPRLSLLTLLIPVRPGLPSPSVSSHAYPALTSTDQASHHPDQGTGLRHTRLLHPRMTYTRMHMYLILISI